MVGQNVSSGPYVGGLNTQGDSGAIGDAELAVCNNFEIDLDGSLKSRPPFVNSGISYAGTTLRFLGYYTTSTGTQYIIASGGTGTYYFNGTAWVAISTAFSATDIAQFQGVLYLLAEPGGAQSGTWDGTTFTADATMPQGVSIVAYKGRLWVATTGSTVRYSAVIRDANFWTVGSTYGGSFSVSYGDGQASVKLLVLSNTLIIFRTFSIWQFSYATDPAAGAQQVLVPDVGLSHSQALAIFEGTAYFLFDGKAYVLNGSNAQQLNTNVPFVATLRSGCFLPFAVSVVGRRIVFSYYNTLYVWNLRSRTWTTWSTPSWVGIGKILQYTGAVTSDLTVYLTHSNFAAASTQPTLRFSDGYTSDKEPSTYLATMRTKTYDYATPDKFKVLFHWGADAIVRGQIVGRAAPVVFSTQVTWGSLLSKTWGQLSAYTWGQPSLASADVQNTIPAVTAGPTPLRKYLRFAKKLRFRRIYYELTATVDGSTSSSPVKVFGLDTVVDVKQLVPNQVN